MPDYATINFQSTATAGSTVSLERGFQRGGEIVRLYAYAVPGEQSDVRRTWYLNKGQEQRNLVLQAEDGQTNSESYLAGDDTEFDLRVSQSFDSDDTLELEIENTDGSNSYPNIAFAEVALGGEIEIVSVLRRWL